MSSPKKCYLDAFTLLSTASHKTLRGEADEGLTGATGAPGPRHTHLTQGGPAEAGCLLMAPPPLTHPTVSTLYAATAYLLLVFTVC